MFFKFIGVLGSGWARVRFPLAVGHFFIVAYTHECLTALYGSAGFWNL